MTLAQIVQSSNEHMLSLQEIINAVEKGLNSIGMNKEDESRYMFSSEANYASLNGKSAFAVCIKDCIISTERGEPMLALVYFENTPEDEFLRACDIFLVYGTYVYRQIDAQRTILDGLRRKMDEMARKKKT